jgi:hypothetical protein
VIDVERYLREELQPAAGEPAETDWADVLERAGEPAPTSRIGRPFTRRRAFALAAAAAVAVALAATAFGVGRQFLPGDPAPPAVQDEAGRLDEVKGELIPRVHDTPGVLVEQTRLAASLDTADGPVYLWSAPTEKGGYCLFLEAPGLELPDGRPNLAGGCNTAPAALEVTSAGSRLRSGAWLQLLYGRAGPSIERLELERDGSSRAVPLDGGGFFLTRLQVETPGRPPQFELVAYDADGDEIARRSQAMPPPQLRPPHASDKGRLPVGGEPLLEIRTRRTNMPIRLYVSDSGGERCVTLVTPGGTSTGCGQKQPGPREIPIQPTQIGAAPSGMLLLWGAVGHEIASLELRFEDGTSEPLPLVEGRTLYQVDPGNYDAGRRPTELVGKDAEGRVIASGHLGPWADAGQ